MTGEDSLLWPAVAIALAIVMLAWGIAAGPADTESSRAIPGPAAADAAPAPGPPPAEGTQPVDPAHNVYAASGRNMLTGPALKARPLVYVPNSGSNTVDVIDPATYRVVRTFPVGTEPQHVVPSYDFRSLYVTSDIGNSVTPIDPRTGRPGRPIPVPDPYNMYFTPDGRSALVVAERLQRLDFRDPETFRLQRSLGVPCERVDHLDFSADGRYLIASCEFSGEMVKVSLRRPRVAGVLTLPDGRAGMPQT